MARAREAEDELTETEERYFKTLLSHPKGVSRERLARQRPPARAYGSNAVDVHIKNLRKKLGPKGYVIESKRGFGYTLRRV